MTMFGEAEMRRQVRYYYDTEKWDLGSMGTYLYTTLTDEGRQFTMEKETSVGKREDIQACTRTKDKEEIGSEIETMLDEHNFYVLHTEWSSGGDWMMRNKNKEEEIKMTTYNC